MQEEPQQTQPKFENQQLTQQLNQLTHMAPHPEIKHRSQCERAKCSHHHHHPWQECQYPIWRLLSDLTQTRN